MDPKYPVQAARDGLEGWVQLTFSIEPDGTVSDIVILASQPKRVFDQAAIQALKKWKYHASIVQGVAVKRSGLHIQLDFNLDKSS